VKKIRLILIVTALILTGCIASKAGGFSIYLLAKEIPSSELSTVDLNDLQLQKEPILSSDDIITYSKQTHEIEVTAVAYERIQRLYSLPVEVRGMPFVVCVGRDRVYAGAFWTPLSSLSFDGVVILQPLNTDRRVIKIELGYPGWEAFTGKDPRSDQRIMRSLEAAGKLK
jgi:hypothetical protein